MLSAKRLVNLITCYYLIPCLNRFPPIIERRLVGRSLVYYLQWSIISSSQHSNSCKGITSRKLEPWLECCIQQQSGFGSLRDIICATVGECCEFAATVVVTTQVQEIGC